MVECRGAGNRRTCRTASIDVRSRPWRARSCRSANGRKQIVVHRVVGPRLYANVIGRYTGRCCCVRRSAWQLYGLYFFASLREVDLSVAVSGRPTIFCSAIRAEALFIAAPEYGGLLLMNLAQSKSALAYASARLERNGSPGRIRTYDRSINSRLLYR